MEIGLESSVVRWFVFRPANARILVADKVANTADAFVGMLA